VEVGGIFKMEKTIAFFRESLSGAQEHA